MFDADQWSTHVVFLVRDQLHEQLCRIREARTEPELEMPPEDLLTSMIQQEFRHCEPMDGHAAMKRVRDNKLYFLV